MDFLMVDKDKLKVTLTPNDIEALAFTQGFDAFGEDSKTRCVFRSILGKARARTGFCADNCKLFVQCFPSKDGGCELFITRLSESDDESSPLPPPKRKPMRSRLRKYLFRTSSFSALVCACKYLENSGGSFLSGVYYDESCGYCLILTLPPRHMVAKAHATNAPDDAFLSRLGEFGQFSPASADTLMYIKEHCRVLSEKEAVKVFSKFTK